MDSVSRHSTPQTGAPEKAKSDESFCTKIWDVVKSIFNTIVYYLTCCQSDLKSENKPKQAPPRVDINALGIKVWRSDVEAAVKEISDKKLTDATIVDFGCIIINVSGLLQPTHVTRVSVRGERDSNRIVIEMYSNNPSRISTEYSENVVRIVRERFPHLAMHGRVLVFENHQYGQDQWLNCTINIPLRPKDFQ